MFVICIILMVLGLALAVLFAILWSTARSRAKASGGTVGPGFLIGGVLAVLLLTVTPGLFLLVRPAAGGGSADPNRSLADVLSNSANGGGSGGGGSSGGGSGGKPAGDDESSGNPEPVDGPSRPAPAPAPAPANPELAQRLSGAVDLMRRQLPLRSGPTTITAVNARGTQLTLDATINVPVPSGQWSVMDQALTAQICSGEFAQIISMGGSAVVNIRDSSGQSHATNVTRCP